MISQSYRTLKSKVEKILEDIPKTRNSDIELTKQIWKTFFPEKIIDHNGHDVVALNVLIDLPREDNVKRIRAKVQNEEGKFLPTDEKVAIKRGLNKLKWRKDLGCPTYDEDGQSNLF